LANQGGIDEDKCKAMVYLLFVKIHEVYDKVIDIETLIMVNIRDNWIFFSKNEYYTPKRYGMILDISGISSDNFGMIPVDYDFPEPFIYTGHNHEVVGDLLLKYLRLAITEMIKDYKEIEGLIKSTFPLK
jgi:hypothetical protein